MKKFDSIAINLFLCVNRIFGISFGGITIGSKGKTSRNKYLIGFGLSLAVITLIYDLYHYIWNFSEHQLRVHRIDLLNNKTNSVRNSILIHRTVNDFNWLSFKTFSLFYLNLKGVDLIEDVVNNCQEFGLNLRTRIKILGLLSVWLIQIISVSCVIFINSLSQHIYYIIWQLEYKLSFIFCWCFCTTLNLISIVHSGRLDQMIKDIDNYAVTKRSGKIITKHEVL